MSNTNITNIETTDTFQIWLNKTNELIELANENVMLAGPLGFTIEGNSTLNGTFTVDTLVAENELILPIGTTAERPAPLIGSLRFNTELETFEGYDGEEWGEIAGAGGTLGNPIFVNDNYVAEVNDYIVADSTAGSFSIILPPTPAEGDIIRVATVSAQTNNIIIAGNGNTFEGSVVDLTVDVDFIILDLVFNSSTWRVFSNFGLGPNVELMIEADTTSDAPRPIAFTEDPFGETDTLFVSIDDLSFNPATKTLSTTNLDATGTASISDDLFVTGEVTAGSFNSLSDVAFKKEISPIESALSIIDQLSGVEFEWKKDSTKSAGVLAQELEQVLPHAVSESNGTKSVNYNVIIAYLIEAIKELKKNNQTD